MNSVIDLKVFMDLSYGLYILTSYDGKNGNGQIINTAVQVTAEPLKVGVIVCKNNLTHEYISKSRVFGVSILNEATPFRFIGLFGFRSGRDVNKLAGTTFKQGITGCPLVTENALGVFEASVTDLVDLGTHSIFIANVVNSETLLKGRPLTYRYYYEVLKGKAPRSAPSFQPLAQENEASSRIVATMR